ncbi:MAG: EF-hand domain-containing protein [Archangium sp.]|nr:EF-hand domain-containing protein [Archangium sp.]
MATKKKKTPKKTPKKKLTPKKAAPKKAAPAPKRKASKRSPPMHGQVSHPELSDGEPENDEVFEIFKTFDRDGSASIDRNELARLLEALGQEVPEDELAIALEVIDVNHSGRISWEEFKAWWSAR